MLYYFSGPVFSIYYVVGGLLAVALILLVVCICAICIHCVCIEGVSTTRYTIKETSSCRKGSTASNFTDNISTTPPLPECVQERTNVRKYSSTSSISLPLHTKSLERCRSTQSFPPKERRRTLSTLYEKGSNTKIHPRRYSAPDTDKLSKLRTQKGSNTHDSFRIPGEKQWYSRQISEPPQSSEASKRRLNLTPRAQSAINIERSTHIGAKDLTVCLDYNYP